MSSSNSKTCPCGQATAYEFCCEPFLQKEKAPPDPEALMRSRYVAFKLKKIDYLLDTNDPQTRQDFDLKANKEWAEGVEFLSLEVLRQESNGTKGLVEFKATYRDLQTGENQIHHEISKFRKQAGVWYFRDGRMVSKR